MVWLLMLVSIVLLVVGIGVFGDMLMPIVDRLFDKVPFRDKLCNIFGHRYPSISSNIVDGKNIVGKHIIPDISKPCVHCGRFHEEHEKFFESKKTTFENYK